MFKKSKYSIKQERAGGQGHIFPSPDFAGIENRLETKRDNLLKLMFATLFFYTLSKEIKTNLFTKMMMS